MPDARALWNECLRVLERDVEERESILWLRPLQARLSEGVFSLQAPNDVVADRVRDHYLPRLQTVVSHLAGESLTVSVGVGSNGCASVPVRAPSRAPEAFPIPGSPLNPDYLFSNFVEGGCNRIARAAAATVAENPGKAYNPLFIYGGVGLGKTHLMHAIGHSVCSREPARRVAYVHSERFVGDMVLALQNNAMGEFKRRYRSLDMLLIDDIQFFSGKERTQEEFFHTFNTLLEARQQVILSCDRYPKEVDGLEERLKSRFGWGLTVAIEPPEIETCVAILTAKAKRLGVDLPHEVAFFVSERIRSNVRELEGSLHRIIAHARFTSRPIDIETAKLALHDLLSLQQRLISLENIQKTVASYYRIRISDLKSTNRSRTVARPRQMAMALAKELTHHSLPEIGDAFGGRDHTTVLHAFKKIKELRMSDPKIQEDYQNLLRIITG
jgi:chromosomal replication initiator protein